MGHHAESVSSPRPPSQGFPHILSCRPASALELTVSLLEPLASAWSSGWQGHHPMLMQTGSYMSPLPSLMLPGLIPPEPAKFASLFHISTSL